MAKSVSEKENSFAKFRQPATIRFNRFMGSNSEMANGFPRSTHNHQRQIVIGIVEDDEIKEGRGND